MNRIDLDGQAAVVTGGAQELASPSQGGLLNPARRSAFGI